MKHGKKRKSHDFWDFDVKNVEVNICL